MSLSFVMAKVVRKKEKNAWKENDKRKRDRKSVFESESVCERERERES